MTKPNRHIIWLVSVSFVLFQFFLQLSSGVVIGEIMTENHLTALTAGLLSGAFYIVYTLLQLPVGILFDRTNSRVLLTLSSLTCCMGCFMFAASHSITGLFLGRLFIGAGSAFAFVGLSHSLRQNYPLRQFGFMIGLSETLGFIATVFGMIALGAVVESWGWRYFINGAGITGLLIALSCWIFIPNRPKASTLMHANSSHLLRILTHRQLWINGWFVGLSFIVVTAFGALWAVPFIQVKCQCNILQASLITSLFFLGTAVSCPLFGILSQKLSKRKPLMFSSCLTTASLLLILIYIPTQSLAVNSVLMFLVGLCCGAYMLAYTISNELAPPGSSSTCTGFTNTLAVVTTPLIQPLIGFLLDVAHQPGDYSLSDYQSALLIIPFCLVLAGVLVCFLPEKPCDA